ncbi:MAG: HAD hydrolase family protein [Bacteroidia bacterium]|nr:HAD hydrolase family protein [Bacteroidia bacterium]
MSEVKMVVTDLDGTLLQSDQSISLKDKETLERLGNLGVCRVAATGRNLFKVRQVLNENSPFDYVIVSSGAGIMDWKSQKLIRTLSIPADLTGEIIHYLISENQNFKVSRELPDNHNFGWWESFDCPELKRYVEHHKKLGDAVKIDPENPFISSQFLMFFPSESNQFELVRDKILLAFPGLSVIRTTSPLDPNYTWMEVFPNGVSKAHGIEEICRITGIARENTLGIGNDFNDLEMLDFTHHSYVVGNAPEELKIKYLISPAHNEDGFSHAVNQHLKDEGKII